MQKLSTERAIGRAILSDPLLAEAFVAFAASQHRHEPNAATYLLRRALQFAGWLEFDRDWKAGPKLEAFRAWAAEDGTGYAPVFPVCPRSRGLSSPRADSHEAGAEGMNVLTFRTPFARLPRQSDGFPAGPFPRPPAG